MINYALILVSMLLLAHCQQEVLSEVRPKEAVFGKAFVLEQGEQLEVKGDAAPLVLQVEKLNDSRCPKEVVCVWLGNAAVTLTVSGRGEASQQLAFCLGDCRPEPVRTKHTVRATISNQTYDLTLLEVMPHPGTEEEEGSGSVKLLIEPVN